MKINASAETEALYGTALTLGVLPDVSMVLWARFFITHWLSEGVEDFRIQFP